MIAKIFTQLPSGVLACLHIRITHPNGVKEYTDVKHCATPEAGNVVMEKMLAKWITDQVVHYCNQRMHALTHAQVYGAQHMAAIKKLEAIFDVKGYANKCAFVVRHQTEINAIMPGTGSPQHIWYYIFHHLIHHCYETTQANNLHPKSNLHPVAEGVPQSAI